MEEKYVQMNLKTLASLVIQLQVGQCIEIATTKKGTAYQTHFGIKHIREFDCNLLLICSFGGSGTATSFSASENLYEIEEFLLYILKDDADYIDNIPTIYFDNNKSDTKFNLPQDTPKKDYKEYKHDINSNIMEQASDIATERLIKAHPDDEVTEIDHNSDGESTHFKEKYQDEFNQYYDEEYSRIALKIGFDLDTEDGILRRVAIGRHVNGISLNDLEYVLTSDNEYMYFASIDEAKQFLMDNGVMDEDDLEDCFVYQYHAFCQSCGKEFFQDIDEETSVPEFSTESYCNDCKHQLLKENTSYS